MPQELLVILLGWVAVIAMPVLIATIILASNTKRKRINSARRSRSLGRYPPSHQAAVDVSLDLLGSGPGEMTTGQNQVEYGLQSEEWNAVCRLTWWPRTII